MSKGNEIRCAKCCAKLAEANFSGGFVSIKCKCGVVNKVSVEATIEMSGEEGTESIIPLDRLPELFARMKIGVVGKEKREFPQGGVY